MYQDRLYDPLLDFRQVSFELNINNQKYELAILSFLTQIDTFFYSIFKPTEYDHVIHLSTATDRWNIVKGDFFQIFKEVCQYNNINMNDYPDILSFINKE